MTPAARRSLFVVLLLLALLGTIFTAPGRETTPTTFGTVPPAYGALFTLLKELQFPVARSYARPEDLPADTTVWWIAPHGVCRRVEASQASTHDEGAGWSGTAWVERGGTAVVFLSPLAEHAGCEMIGDVRVPDRVQADTAAAEREQTDATPSTSSKPDDWFRSGALREQQLTGRLAPHPRRIASPALATFSDTGEWETVAALDGHPFVIERALGGGRLVLIADARWVRNAWLDRADHAPFAVDVVRTYGVPHFDERQHGLRIEDSAVRYLLTSAALPLLVGLALVGMVFVWQNAALPGRTLADTTIGAPTLETFVDSLAALYVTTRDYPRVLEHYRELTAARLRRHFGLAPQTPLGVLLERLRTRRVPPAALQYLAGTLSVTDASGLRGAVRQLDRLVWEATR